MHFFIRYVAHFESPRFESVFSDHRVEGAPPLAAFALWTSSVTGMNSPVTIHSALNLNLFSGGIAVELCRAACFERACSAIAVLEKLDVGHLPPSKRANKPNGDVISFPVTFDL
jgi:hypothetical protein